MEIRIGVVQTTRELTLESNETPETVLKLVEEAIASDSLIALTDEHERRVIVPASKLAYIELGDPRSRQVGFGL